MDRKFATKIAAAFEDELKKIAANKALVGGLAAGALGTMALQRAHRDWRMGRAMRLQNQSY